MTETARLAGFMAAHAILGVSQGKSLSMPMIVVEIDDGRTQFLEVKEKSSQAAVIQAERLLKQPAAGATRAALAFEAYLNLPPGQTDAIFLHARSYRPETHVLLLAVPFRAADSPGGFAVFRPKLIAREDAPFPPGVLEAFWRGVALHPPGQKVWDEHRDDSR